MARIILFLVTLVTILISNVESGSGYCETKATTSTNLSDEKKTICPSFVQTADFSNPAELAAVQREILIRLWSIPFPKMSLLGEAFKDFIFEMANDSDPVLKSYALATSQWIWAYSPEIYRQNINLCSYTRMINSTIAFIEEEDCSRILNAISESITALGEAGGMHLYHGIINSGCATESTQPVQTTGEPCYDDGFTYRFNKMWNLRGRNFPIEYRKIVYKMYKSTNEVDKVMALLATAALSEQMGVIENNFDPALKYQLFFIATTDEIDESCCENFFGQIQTLGGKLQIETSRVLQLARESTQCPL